MLLGVVGVVLSSICHLNRIAAALAFAGRAKGVLRGHCAYYGLPCNYRLMQAPWWEVRRLWFSALKRRDRRRSLTWARLVDLLERFPLPRPTITDPCQAARAGLG